MNITENKIPSSTPAPMNLIRVETGLSRYPVHRLAKHGNISIDIHEKNASGEVTIKWEVNYIGKFGQPGPLAYKLDTLVINRRIEEITRPIPRIIRIGSLKELAAQLELGGDTNLVKKALRQNASTFIIANINYKRPDGTTKKLEADFNRYSVVFTGEELPDGRKADAVYIVLNDIFMQVINGAMTRPLDYDYLKILPPAAQRFYELLSYQMYAAIKNDRDRAKLVYSELCKYAPLTRQTDWNIVRPQLSRIHAPHKKSGYIGKIDFQDTTDSDGKPDWIILYQPGTKARAEFRAFTKRGGPVMLEVEALSLDSLPLLPSPKPPPLETALIGHGITPAIAAELVRQHGEEAVSLQIEHLEWLNEKKPGKIAEPGAWLRTAITNGITPPKRFVPKAERERLAAVRRQKDEDAAASRRQQREQEAKERELVAQVQAYLKALTPDQMAMLEAEAIAQASEKQRESLDDPTLKPFRKALLSRLAAEHIGRLLAEGKLSPHQE